MTCKCISETSKYKKVEIKLVVHTSKFLHSVCLPSISTPEFKTFKLICPCWFVDKETTITAHPERIKETIRAEYLCYSEVLLGTQKCSIKWKLPSTIQSPMIFSSKSLFKALLCRYHHTHKKSTEATRSANFISVSTVVTRHIFLATTETYCTFFFYSHVHG